MSFASLHCELVQNALRAETQFAALVLLQAVIMKNHILSRKTLFHDE